MIHTTFIYLSIHSSATYVAINLLHSFLFIVAWRRVVFFRSKTIVASFLHMKVLILKVFTNHFSKHKFVVLLLVFQKLLKNNLTVFPIVSNLVNTNSVNVVSHNKYFVYDLLCNLIQMKQWQLSQKPRQNSIAAHPCKLHTYNLYCFL